MAGPVGGFGGLGNPLDLSETDPASTDFADQYPNLGTVYLCDQCPADHADEQVGAGILGCRIWNGIDCRDRAGIGESGVAPDLASNLLNGDGAVLAGVKMVVVFVGSSGGESERSRSTVLDQTNI